MEVKERYNNSFMFNVYYPDSYNYAKCITKYNGLVLCLPNK